ncbi:hypothetical protein ASC97_18940 [Rhizobium sp. Root1203]|nr:hypothetical protein ASC97_18940 [Rhizobium sp. Root1203]
MAIILLGYILHSLITAIAILVPKEDRICAITFQSGTFNHKINLGILTIKNLLIFFHFRANYRLIRETRYRLVAQEYPMMLRSAASPGSWGRSAGMQH